MHLHIRFKKCDSNEMFCRPTQLFNQFRFQSIVHGTIKYMVGLTVKNKFIIQMQTSETQTKLLKMIKILIIEDCNMKELKANSFLGMASLNELYLNNDQLEKIANDCFNGLELNLKILEITSNQIKIINKEMLKNLFNLQILRIFSNEIEGIETEAFNSLSKLNLLRLNGNKIKIIQNGLFKNLKFLKFYGSTIMK